MTTYNCIGYTYLKQASAFGNCEPILALKLSHDIYFNIYL